MLDKGKILCEIQADNPAGKYLRYENVYDEIKEAMREDDVDLSQGVWQKKLKKADWGYVEELCCSILENESKDLQVCVWLVEACIELYKWKGLALGIEFLLEFAEKFWDIAYPTLSDDLEYRFAPFMYSAKKIQDRLMFLPISAPQNSEFSVKNLANLIEAKSEAKNDSQFDSFLEIRTSQDSTDNFFFIETQHYLSAAYDNLKKLDKFLNIKSSEFSPSFSSLKKSLEVLDAEMCNIIKARKLEIWPYDELEYSHRIVENNSEDIDKSAEEGAVNEEVSDHPSFVVNSLPNENISVAQAYDLLNKICVFLEKAQPQSLSPILLKTAIYLNNQPISNVMEMKTKDGEPAINCISKLYEIMK